MEKKKWYLAMKTSRAFTGSVTSAKCFQVPLLTDWKRGRMVK